LVRNLHHRHNKITITDSNLSIINNNVISHTSKWLRNSNTMEAAVLDSLISSSSRMDTKTTIHNNNNSHLVRNSQINNNNNKFNQGTRRARGTHRVTTDHMGAIKVLVDLTGGSSK
jgi:hypothetical protein